MQAQYQLQYCAKILKGFAGFFAKIQTLTKVQPASINDLSYIQIIWFHWINRFNSACKTTVN